MEKVKQRCSAGSPCPQDNHVGNHNINVRTESHHRRCVPNRANDAAPVNSGSKKSTENTNRKDENQAEIW